jgi:tetratricopeptide (TPR) repeat protein
VKKIFLIILLFNFSYLFCQNIEISNDEELKDAVTVFFETSEYSKAVKILEEYLESFPESITANYYLGWIYSRKNDYDAAIQLMKNALEYSKQDNLELEFRIQNDLGWTYFLSGDIDMAEKKLETLVEVSEVPVSERLMEAALNNLGIINIYKKDYVQAEEYFGTAAVEYGSIYAQQNLDYLSTIEEKGD